jgi:hypothetical protein
MWPIGVNYVKIGLQKQAHFFPQSRLHPCSSRGNEALIKFRTLHSALRIKASLVTSAATYQQAAENPFGQVASGCE